MTPEQAEQAATVAGSVTAVVGASLVAAPSRLGGLSGVHDPGLLRRIGWSDVVLAPGLLVGRPRWPWLAARAVTNLVVGARLLREPTWSARFSGATLVALTAVDGRAAAVLRSAGR